MLVLSRHRDETIIIGDDIELTVVDIRGDKVRLGIKAPSHVAVHRKEVYDAIKRENERAAGLDNATIVPTGTSVAPGQRKPIASAVRIPKPKDSTRRESA